jgi:RNA polymerase sigma-70 factor (ECF subfamily)
MPTAVESGKYDEEIIEAVNRYVEERLTPQTSRIIRMHFDEDQSYKEISNSLGISLSAVNKHIVQGLRKLRSTFKNREA